MTNRILRVTLGVLLLLTPLLAMMGYTVYANGWPVFLRTLVYFAEAIAYIAATFFMSMLGLWLISRKQR